MHKYPKLILLTAMFFVAYALYHEGLFDWLPAFVNGYGYLSLFVGGMLFSFGFTTPFALVIFVEMAPSVHPLLGAAVAGGGALLSDYTIFRFVRFSLQDELMEIVRLRFFRFIHRMLHHDNFPERLRQYLLWSVAGLVIASPLPDEVGVTLLSGATELDPR